MKNITSRKFRSLIPVISFRTQSLRRNDLCAAMRLKTIRQAAIYPAAAVQNAYSVSAQTLAGRPVAPLNLGQAAISTAPAGATW